MYSNTESAPSSFGEIISRFVPPDAPEARLCRPLVGMATEMVENGPNRNVKMWVIMHTVTSTNVRLYHAQPLRGRKLSVRFDGPAGEIVQVLLAVDSTVQSGDLYETTASFYR